MTLGTARPACPVGRGGPAASFRCAQCGELAGVVRVVRPESSPGLEPPGRLILDCFLGTTRRAQDAETLNAVQALIEQGNVDPAAIRALSWDLWEITPFYCAECGLNYCARDWDTYFDFNLMYDCIMGICPNGHRPIVG
jgi:hypothetical protein